MCFGQHLVSTLGAGAKTRLESRIKKYKPHCVCRRPGSLKFNCHQIKVQKGPSTAESAAFHLAALTKTMHVQSTHCNIAHLDTLFHDSGILFEMCFAHKQFHVPGAKHVSNPRIKME